MRLQKFKFLQPHLFISNSLIFLQKTVYLFQTALMSIQKPDPQNRGITVKTYSANIPGNTYPVIIT